MTPHKLPLANLPTPLFRHPQLDRLVGAEVWVKRDDMTGGVETGNKIRKLEYLLADAKAQGATSVVTCGGVQSNHCRATAILARNLGMSSVLLLRHGDLGAEPAPIGNLLLDRLVGADIRLISPAQYADRDTLMGEVAAERAGQGETTYVIPEGGSNGLGALGYVDAVQELADQLSAGQGPGPVGFDAIAFACGSGGTAAGVALGLGRHPVAKGAIAFAVCDDRAYFDARVSAIIAEARTIDGSLPAPAPLSIEDRFKGPAYGLASPEQTEFIVQVARAAGLIVDPVYSGKALFGLAHLPDKPARVCFVHTGGHPGLLAQPDTFRF